VDAKGKLYFVDRRFNRIYSWSKEGGLAVVRDAPLDPVNLAIDKSGAILVLSSSGLKARCTPSIPTSRPARSPSSSRRR
jgi:sugar lactone lactonase YvrE